MGLFSRKKEADTESKEIAVVAKAPTKALTTDRNLSQVIVGPRITEKSVKMGESNVYTFTIARFATKFQVRDAIKALYSVTPVKINIVNKLPAHRMSGAKNRLVKVPGYKKAYVYLKKGDTINLV